MPITVKIEKDGRPSLSVNNESWIEEIGLRIPIDGRWQSDRDGEIVGGGWSDAIGADETGTHRGWRQDYSFKGEHLLTLHLREYGDAILSTVELHKELNNLSQTDSFDDPTFLAPTFAFRDELRFSLATFGLGHSGDGYPGGYWPTVQTGRGHGELPQQAFAPLVCFSERGAVAIAPANYFLTSPMVRTPGGAARGLHGAVDSLPAGTKIETVFAIGEDLPAALIHLGNFLLARGGKERPQPGNTPLTSSLGWWNAYGGYYTELIRSLNERELEGMIESLNNQGIPLGYLGLDLWYPYQEIGQAIQYIPDPKKYPHGLGEIAARANLPAVLHLSALSPKNAYAADGADPHFYREVAKEIASQRGITAWHDWLRTQQHLTPVLRRDPTVAEHWFTGMAEAFAGEDLSVLLCMQTMGMNLASTAQKNVTTARSHTDFLFAQKEALETAAALGHGDLLEAWTPPGDLHQQNLWMGMLLYALGMMPFHDLFLSHPSPDLGGDHPEEEAILRALSCGPVGIGDGPGMVDEELIDRLLLSDGTLAQPDRPPFPVTETIDHDIEAFWTERNAGSTRWIYLLLLNTASKELLFSLDPPFEGEFMIWDGLRNQRQEAIEGRLAPGRLAYFVLVPQHEGIAPLGLWKRFVPAPMGKILDLQWEEGWRIRLDGVEDEFAILSEQPVSVHTNNGVPLELSHRGDLWICKVEGQVRNLHVFRR
jgi:hypothetical protein